MSVPSRAAPVARCLARGLLLAAGATGAAGISAQTRWIHSLTVPAEIEYDSNPQMSVAPTSGTTFVRVTPNFVTRYVEGRDDYGLEASLTAEKSSNQEVAQDRLDPRLRAVWKHAAPLWSSEVAALLDRSALRDLGLGEQVPLGSDGSRTLFGISGRWTRDLDPRTSVAVEGSQEWERYSGAVTPDFRRTSAEARLTRAMSERQSIYGLLNGQVYRSDAAPNAVPLPLDPQNSTVVGAMAGVEHAFSPLFRIDAAAGPLHFAEPDSRTGWQGAFKAEYTAERWEAGLELLRVPVVNATFGGLVQSDQVRMRVRYDLDPLSRLEMEAGHGREKAARSSRSLASVAWVRQMSESWQVSLKASVHRQAGPEGTARSNRIGVLLQYTAPDL
ncbi:MAG: hypothetical protein K0R89_886 [Ramlibacter sp.]|nr:hypothetical protein [Ramlibacter sp.]